MCQLSFLFIYYFFFQIEDDPIPIESAPAVADISISEGVPVDPIPSVEASIFAKRQDFSTADALMEKFPTETDIVANTRISATNVPLGDVSAH